ncbi:MAG TPA: PHP domain-containing protein [Blastocatellia bacterium]|nr:PHP domain-containing protein [Blastocatellia bacterium]
MSAGIIDLHTHTTQSDGSATPEELIAMASAKRARAVAITDHDTVAALTSARVAAERFDIEFVAGIEISAEYSPGTMHVLGYYIDEQSASLSEKLNELRRAREKRNPEIASRLRALGVDINYEEVAELAGNEVVGRPHFARLMVERSYARSIQDAFDRFLKKGAPAYVEKARLSPRESIALIRAAGGVAVLAHPYQLGLSSYEGVDTIVAELVGFGLEGIEALYSRHNPAQRAAYAEIASRYRLLVTGGSDFHGAYKPDIDLVTGLGDLQVPYALLEEVKARAASRSQQSAPYIQSEAT